MAIWLPLAEAGDCEAAGGLSLAYAVGGEGVPKDDAAALKWIRVAAAGGKAGYQYRLAKLCGNPMEATEMLRRAAVQGHE